MGLFGEDALWGIFLSPDISLAKNGGGGNYQYSCTHNIHGKDKNAPHRLPC